MAITAAPYHYHHCHPHTYMWVVLVGSASINPTRLPDGEKGPLSPTPCSLMPYIWVQIYLLASHWCAQTANFSLPHSQLPFSGEALSEFSVSWLESQITGREKREWKVDVTLCLLMETSGFIRSYRTVRLKDETPGLILNCDSLLN